MGDPISLLLGLLTATGVLVWSVAIIALLHYRPDLTPNGTLREAITQIRWSYAIALFVLPPTLVGLQDGVPLLGFSFGAGFVAFMVVVMWWYPI